MTEAMSAEFDTVAAWTAEVAVDLGPDFHIPAGCRGSGSPAALDWLIDGLGLTRSDRMLDCGAGLGGPAAFAAERAGVRPVLAEPETGACHGAGRLFALPVVQGAASALPFTGSSFDVAWCLGVLCTTDDQPGLLAELHRVLTPVGRLGLLVFVAATVDVANQPEGNNFPTSDELRTLLRTAHFEIDAMAPSTAFGPDAAAWTQHVNAVDAELDRRHHDEPPWQVAQHQSATFGLLLASGQVTSTLIVAHAVQAAPRSPLTG